MTKVHNNQSAPLNTSFYDYVSSLASFVAFDLYTTFETQGQALNISQLNVV